MSKKRSGGETTGLVEFKNRLSRNFRFLREEVFRKTQTEFAGMLNMSQGFVSDL